MFVLKCSMKIAIIKCTILVAKIWKKWNTIYLIPTTAHITATIPTAITPIQNTSVQTHSQKPVRYSALSCCSILPIFLRCSSCNL